MLMDYSVESMSTASDNCYDVHLNHAKITAVQEQPVLGAEKAVPFHSTFFPKIFDLSYDRTDLRIIYPIICPESRQTEG